MVTRIATTRRTSPSLTTIRTLDADTSKEEGISSNKEEGIKEEDTRTKVAVTKDTKEEEDSKVVAEAIIRIRVAVLEEEAVAMAVAMEISIINKVAVIVVLLQPTRLDSLDGMDTTLGISTIRVMIRDHSTQIRDGSDNQLSGVTLKASCHTQLQH